MPEMTMTTMFAAQRSDLPFVAHVVFIVLMNK